MSRFIELEDAISDDGDAECERPAAIVKISTDIDIATDYGRTAFPVELWPALRDKIDAMLAIRERFLKGDAA